MFSFYFLFIFFLLFSFNSNINYVAKAIKPPINVYYKDYSENLPTEEKYKLMKILLESEDDENENMKQGINIQKLQEKEKDLELLMKEQSNLSKKIQDLKRCFKKKRNMSIKYTHDEEDMSSESNENLNKEDKILNVDTEIEASIDSMKAPIAIIKIPSMNIYDQFDMQHYVGNLIDLNEELFY